jgi:oligoendopeptidase F
MFWPYMAVVDSFQHWVYLNPAKATNPDNCDEKWSSLWQRFMPDADYTDFEDVVETGWHRKLHIHLYPFYYVEYGLAQLGAIQIWRRALENQTDAVAGYRRALALGGTAKLPELYATAGAQFAFDAVTLKDAVDLVTETLESFENA